MRRRLPPDRDNDLRHAISLNRDEQIRLLHGFAGESIAMPLRPTSKNGCNFTHYGGTTKTGPRGSYVYMPTPIPPTVADADTQVLVLTVEHGDLDRRVHPRHPSTIAKLKAVIETALPLRGTHELRIHTPPRRWTAAHLEWLVRTMAGYLPPATTPGQPIGFDIFGARADSITIRVTRTTDPYAFQVTCDISPIGLRPALDSWCHTVGGRPGAILGNEPLTAGPEPPDTPADSAAADDDLDPIEKACRRRLHGERSSTPRPPTTAEPDASVSEKLLDILRLAQINPDYFDAVHRVALELLGPNRGKDR